MWEHFSHSKYFQVKFLLMVSHYETWQWSDIMRCITQTNRFLLYYSWGLFCRTFSPAALGSVTDVSLAPQGFRIMLWEETLPWLADRKWISSFSVFINYICINECCVCMYSAVRSMSAALRSVSTWHWASVECSCIAAAPAPRPTAGSSVAPQRSRQQRGGRGSPPSPHLRHREAGETGELWLFR